MADDETDANEDAEDVNLPGEDGEDDEEGGGSKKLIIIIVGVVVLLLGAGAGLYFTGMLDSVLGKSEPCVEEVDDHGEVIKECPEEDAHGDEHAAKDDGHGGGHGDGHGGGGGNFIEIPPMLVNLSSNDGTPRYLRLTVQLELSSSADYAAVEAVIPRVVDQFQTYLRELRVKDLRGSAGIYRLQMELLWRVNQAAAPVKVKDVLFQEILIQ
ncbi:MAG: flagellar basal body-associated FliL family protein [Alphaproteobacteria bacterium]|nr:flagellar basal body-associated FliL family protein [Alphaproteobacteria bacterium]